MEIKELKDLNISDVLNFLSIDYFYNADIITSIKNMDFKNNHIVLFAIIKNELSQNSSLKENDYSSDYVRKEQDYIAILYINREEAHIYMPVSKYKLLNKSDIKNLDNIDALYSEYNDQMEAIQKLSNILSSFDVSFVSINSIYESELNLYLNSNKIEKQAICVYKINPNKGFDFEARLRLNRNMKINKNCSVMVSKGNNELSSKILALHNSCFAPRICNSFQYSKLIYKNLLRVYYIEQAGQIIAKGEWIANNSKIGYISGLCTLKEYRFKKMASTVLFRMLRDIMFENRIPILRYDIPELGSFYKNVGFELTGNRSVLWLKI